MDLAIWLYLFQIHFSKRKILKAFFSLNRKISLGFIRNYTQVLEKIPGDGFNFTKALNFPG